MSMVAAYNELQCVCQKFVTLFCHYMASVHNQLQCVYMPELCQKFVTLFVLIIRISFASCCNEMSAQMN
jgi:hypothetical protein